MTKARAAEGAAPGADSYSCVESRGAWPFTSHRRYRHPDGREVLWQSRDHRKGLRAKQGGAKPLAARLWRVVDAPGELNWWIGILFALGAALFMLGSLLSLSPGLAASWSLDGKQVAAVFFAGSIPFTGAAFLQLLQAANAREFIPGGESPPQHGVIFAWRPADMGWLACALQFAGTLLFNINTWDGMKAGLDWQQQDMLIWAPDLVGSALFLASGYLAFVETCHAHWAFKPASISWWLTLVNLIGCIAFMFSALYAFVPPQPLGLDGAAMSNAYTLVGAAAFFLGALLLLPETALSSADP